MWRPADRNRPPAGRLPGPEADPGNHRREGSRQGDIISTSRGRGYAHPGHALGVEIAPAGAKGRGVFAARPFARGEPVVVGKAIHHPPKRTRMSVQVDWELHVEMDVPATLLNHSCAPNLGARENRWCAYDFVALRDIAAGEELTFDYAMTEHELVAPLPCCCGSVGCIGEIRAWSDRDQEWREQNAIWVARYLRVSSPPVAGQRLEQLT